MIKIELLELAGLIPALQALRLPYSKEPRSYAESKEEKTISEPDSVTVIHSDMECVNLDDINLASRLVKAGDEHSKCLRGVIAYVEITAPRYYWHEFVTYKVGCECLSSSSTMHTIAKGVTPEMFSTTNECEAAYLAGRLQGGIDIYNATTDPTEKELAFMNIKRNIPECFLQTRIFAISYQTLRRIYFQRRHHRLPEWREFCRFIEGLPFADTLITPDKDGR